MTGSTGLTNPPENQIGITRTSRGDQIYVMRVPGSPSREEIQDYMRQTGAQLVGAYKIYGGVPSRDQRDQMVDGVEFIFKMGPRQLGEIVEKDVPIHQGVDLTGWYQQ